MLLDNIKSHRDGDRRQERLAQSRERLGGGVEKGRMAFLCTAAIVRNSSSHPMHTVLSFRNYAE